MAIAGMLYCISAMVSCTHEPQVISRSYSFKGDILPILETSCALNGDCHFGANNGNAQISFDSGVAYSTIIAKHLVSTGSPTASLLYVEVSTGIMPKAPYSALSGLQIETILNWIKQGAQNN